MIGTEEEDAESRLRILLVGSFPPQAQGISGYCGALAMALAKKHDVIALGFKAMYPACLFPGVKAPTDSTSPIPAAHGLTVRHALAWYNPLGWIIESLRTPADVVHIQWWSLPLAPIFLTIALIARLRSLPVIVTAHNVRPHEASPWFLRASRLLYRLADHVLVHSENNRDQLRADVPQIAACITHVPMGPLGSEGPRPPRKEARARLGLSSEAPTLLFFGTIRPYKGLADLLRAFERVREIHPQAKLIIAGKPWESWEPYQALIDAAALGESIHLFLDYIPESDVADFFVAADLVVLPYTHFDAQSAVGVQALGFETPLLVTRTGGLPDLVAGDPAWIVPPGKSDDLAAALNAFLGDIVAARLRFQAVADRARDALSWRASLRAHDRVYRMCMKANHPDD